jgi:hypothetical protein
MPRTGLHLVWQLVKVVLADEHTQTVTQPELTVPSARLRLRLP